VIPWGEGVYRRRIRLVADGLRVRADLEDDFHRFGVELVHDGACVVEARATAHRFPWETCPGAGSQIEALVGIALLPRAVDLAEHTDSRRHCTHLYDLAALALAHAAAGRERRQYDIAVPDRDDWKTRATLHRDGALALDWELDARTIRSPERFAGLTLRGRPFLDWIHANLDADESEAALVLRRAVYIAIGRATDLDAIATAADVTPLAGASCHSMQPAVAPRALRVKGSTRQFSASPEPLLSDLD